jgi:Family of unknown function (DUF6065)
MPQHSTRKDVDDKRPEHVTNGQEPYLIAYRYDSGLVAPRIVPAPISRSWMTATREHFANRCLPLLVANENGWFILNSHAFVACWSGQDAKEEIQIEYLSGPEPYPAHSHFGYGILTWNFPYLFRTSPGYNLLVRGPANYPKDGVYALDGIVETDWAVAPFTFNLQLTHPGLPVRFDVDEPVCMLVPQRRGELEAFRPMLHNLEYEPDIHSQYLQWNQSRSDFLASLREPHAKNEKDRWQKHYFRGTSPGGFNAPEHQTKLRLREFDEIVTEGTEEPS